MVGRSSYRLYLVVAVTFIGAPAVAEQSALSEAQVATIAKITAGVSAGDKHLISGWSDGKKLAEFFCTQPGLKEIAKQHQSADRLFLGTSEAGEEQFTIEGNRRLYGDASVRIGAEWKSITFDCVLDPDKAVVTSFTYKHK